MTVSRKMPQPLRYIAEIKSFHPVRRNWDLDNFLFFAFEVILPSKQNNYCSAIPVKSKNGI